MPVAPVPTIRPSATAPTPAERQATLPLADPRTPAAPSVPTSRPATWQMPTAATAATSRLDIRPMRVAVAPSTSPAATLPTPAAPTPPTSRSAPTHPRPVQIPRRLRSVRKHCERHQQRRLRNGEHGFRREQRRRRRRRAGDADRRHRIRQECSGQLPGNRLDRCLGRHGLGRRRFQFFGRLRRRSKRRGQQQLRIRYWCGQRDVGGKSEYGRRKRSRTKRDRRKQRRCRICRWKYCRWVQQLSRRRLGGSSCQRQRKQRNGSKCRPRRRG